MVGWHQRVSITNNSTFIYFKLSPHLTASIRSISHVQVQEAEGLFALRENIQQQFPFCVSSEYLWSNRKQEKMIWPLFLFGSSFCKWDLVRQILTRFKVVGGSQKQWKASYCFLPHAENFRTTVRGQFGVPVHDLSSRKSYFSDLFSCHLNNWWEEPGTQVGHWTRRSKGSCSAQRSFPSDAELTRDSPPWPGKSNIQQCC